MTDCPPPGARQRRIAQLDRTLQRAPDAIDARYERAGLLREQGLFEAAKRDYLELLRRMPTDFAVLNDFGALVLTAGYKDAARSLFSEAVHHHPDNPKARVNLANLLLLIGEPDEARLHFEAALRIEPDHRHAHRGMGNLLAESGDATGARRHRDKAFKEHFLTPLPYRGDGPAVSVLLVVSAAGGNIPTASILDDRCFRTTVLVAEYDDPNRPLPAHDLAFNAIGDADLCGDGLGAAVAVLRRTARPVVNHPDAVRKTGRAANVVRLRGQPGVVVPRMAMLPRRLLAGSEAGSAIAGQGFGFPFLLRAPGFHTGRHFVRVDDLPSLAAAAAALPTDQAWLIELLDSRNEAGMHHKFRVMMVDRQLYPLHLAISPNWKVHYFTAAMADSAAHRTADAAFLHDMTDVVGRRGVAALMGIAAALDLDYGGVDFAVNGQGDVLFFEANATMVMLPPTPEPKWAYRRPAFDAVFAAVHAMLMARAGAAAAARSPAPLRSAAILPGNFV